MAPSARMPLVGSASSQGAATRTSRAVGGSKHGDKDHDIFALLRRGKPLVGPSSSSNTKIRRNSAGGGRGLSYAS